MRKASLKIQTLKNEHGCDRQNWAKAHSRYNCFLSWLQAGNSSTSFSGIKVKYASVLPISLCVFIHSVYLIKYNCCEFAYSSLIDSQSVLTQMMIL